MVWLQPANTTNGINSVNDTGLMNDLMCTSFLRFGAGMIGLHDPGLQSLRIHVLAGLEEITGPAWPFEQRMPPHVS